MVIVTARSPTVVITRGRDKRSADDGRGDQWRHHDQAHDL